jgi:hypothetical protein
MGMTKTDIDIRLRAIELATNIANKDYRDIDVILDNARKIENYIYDIKVRMVNNV